MRSFKKLLQNDLSSVVHHSFKYPSRIIVVLTLILFLRSTPSHLATGIKWLGVYRLPRSADHPPDTTADRFTSAECHTASAELGFRRRQTRFCNHPRFGYAMLAVLRAAHAVGYHCPKAFSDRRWNCTSVHRLPQVSPELKRGTREQALVHAFSSAALLFEIGRFCARNKIRFCSCGDEHNAYPEVDLNQDSSALVYESGMDSNGMSSSGTVNGQAIAVADQTPTVSRFYWAGCSDNLHIAREYSSAFLGYPNIRVMDLLPTELFNGDEAEGNGRDPARVRRSLDLQEPDDVDIDDEDEDDVPEVSSEPPFQRNQRFRRHLPYLWDYSYPSEGTAQEAEPGSVQQPYRPFGYRPVGTLPLRGHFQFPPGRWPRKMKQRDQRGRSQIIRVMDRHNYLAGVVLMEANHRMECKCHGVSGSCSQRVCFRQLRRIDDPIMQRALKARYLAAKQVSMGSNKQLIAKTFTGSGFVDEVVKATELVFSEHSPDYCNREPHRGSIGTHDRICVLKDAGTASCLNMCCGRGYKNVTTHGIEQCNCRMGEGFKVKCDECPVKKITQRCL